MVAAWAEFALLGALIGAAGFRLTREADDLAARLGLSRTWVGVALVATVTSLPELATGITAVTIAEAPNIAVGNALGACVMNLGFLAVLDVLVRGEPIYRRASPGHILAAAFGVSLLGFVAVAILLGQAVRAAGGLVALDALGLSFSLATPVLLLLYLVAVRAVFFYERGQVQPVAGSGRLPPAMSPPWRGSALRFGLAAAIVVVAGMRLPFVASDLAEAMGWSRSFVGTVLVAAATTLPEMAVTLSALRLRAYDLAIGNLLGSNLFNVAIIAVDDLFYTRGPLLADVSPVHALTAASAAAMTGLAVVGLFYRPQGRVLRAVGWVSLGLAALFLLNAVAVRLAGT